MPAGLEFLVHPHHAQTRHPPGTWPWLSTEDGCPAPATPTPTPELSSGKADSPGAQCLPCWIKHAGEGEGPVGQLGRLPDRGLFWQAQNL